MTLLIRIPAGLTCLLLVTACESEPRNTSKTEFEKTDDGTRLIEPGFRTVLRVDLRPGTSYDELSKLQDKYARFSGVESGGGSVGEGVANALIIFSPKATKDEVVAVRRGLSNESIVEQVKVEHRK